MYCEGKELKGKDKEDRAVCGKRSNRLICITRAACGGESPSLVGDDL